MVIITVRVVNIVIVAEVLSQSARDAPHPADNL